ncbi:hypothetical protein NQ315_014140 [Exocentrus adspersus]|uniref:Uncharacterized protein n=1 Tax=Exocentrus adspersus TaxID=1586481 RepID=A0AAV8VVV7_9CUCU|nr:hypothetical protein NQ315_014140 [Exocentrus adspersus]
MVLNFNFADSQRNTPQGQELPYNFWPSFTFGLKHRNQNKCGKMSPKTDALAHSPIVLYLNYKKKYVIQNSSIDTLLFSDQLAQWNRESGAVSLGIFQT